MFTQIEETMPLLSKKEYIALEIAKALIADQKSNCMSLTTLMRDSANAAHILLIACNEIE